MIYTSYFAQLKNLPENIVPISICGKAPVWYKGIQYKKLAPKYDFFMEWKQNHDNNYYIEHFQKEVLDQLNINNVIKELYNLSKGKDIVLICYEKPTDFCHRHLVASWIREVGLLKCEEWNKKIMYLEKFITTTDDWYPNYNGNKVKVFLLNQTIKNSKSNFVRIAVYGNDDFGLEMDFQGTEQENDLKFKEWKENIYDKIPEPCSQKYFEDLGFVNI